MIEGRRAIGKMLKGSFLVITGRAKEASFPLRITAIKRFKLLLFLSFLLHVYVDRDAV